MRRKKTTSELETYAVSGTNTVVLSLDQKSKPAGLLGFAFERVEAKSKKRIRLYGQKFFHSVIPIDEKDLKKYSVFKNDENTLIIKGDDRGDGYLFHGIRPALRSLLVSRMGGAAHE